ncbi:hypothetical protein L211DRAFT_850353 [Terfezia boudieri ATCC MYA-4762]|uniref:Uncharacterized protein n=1 Tax=Terfezia boudieri ATCC MYA-4762 TaxID=1051890 RepID=A0A3N4LJK3_9PEZI|nr:hypothetical protein L211DRAFT_850353 [Terfezia boudieri ATCC MYA-4762]
MCLWKDHIHPACGHHTHIELGPGIKAEVALAKRCQIYKQCLGDPHREKCSIQFEYDQVRAVQGLPWAHPDFYTTQLQVGYSCYSFTCREINNIPLQVVDGWSTASTFTRARWAQQPRFTVPRAGHSREQMERWMWTEIIHCQRITYFACRYAQEEIALCIGRQDLLDIQSKRDEYRSIYDPQVELRRKYERKYNERNEELGRIFADQELILHWMRGMRQKRVLDLDGSPYVCVDEQGRYGLCPGALQLDRNCPCNSPPQQ